MILSPKYLNLDEKYENNNGNDANNNLLQNLIKIVIILILLIYKFFYKIKIENIENLEYDNIFHNYTDILDEKKIAREYLKLCQNGTLIGNTRYKRNINPKFTIIVPVYNRENCIKRAIRSIQNQSYKNIEIILVDDNSKDNSVKIIEELKKKDKRIRLIKHKKNQGTLITRNDGALKARGEFITFIDPDDLLYPGILQKLSGATIIYDSEIIRFDAFFFAENYLLKYDYGDYFKKNKVLTQPEIFHQTFYMENGNLFQHNLFLWGKIIKRELFLELIDNLSDYYKRQHWTLYEDNAMDFVLLKYAQTYTFIEENGYIYCYNKMSSYSKRKEVYKANRTVKDVFLLAEICFDYTNNNEYEKEMAVFQLKRLLREYQKSLRLVNEGFEYYNRILNKFSECKFISNQNKRFIGLIRDILSTAEKNAKS